MAPKWTAEQKAAIETLDRHVGVSAGAGSGKTTVMVERAVRILMDGGDVRDILMITFTNNAAAQMKAGIRKRLEAALLEDPSRHLRTQLLLLPSAAISTIDSFCWNMVGEFYPLLGVDPLLRLAGEVQRKGMIGRALNDTLEEYFERGDEAFFQLLEQTGGEEALGALLIRLQEIATTGPDPAGYYERLVVPYENTKWMKGQFDTQKEEDTARQVMGALLPVAAILRDLCLAFSRRYEAEKEREGLADFAQVEQLALVALREPQIVEELKGRYRYVFVDEYQDINPLQEAIILSLPGNHFFVGDVKQSIYGFRQAQPGLMLQRMEGMAVDGDGVAIYLNKNFRSTPALLDGINRVFDRIMSPTLGGVDYEKDHRMVSGKGEGDKGERPRLMIVPTKAGAYPTATVGQGVAMAQEIKRLHEEDGIPYGEMAILFRAFTGREEAAREALQTLEIPVVMPVRGAQLNTPAVIELLALLRYIDDGMDDVALLSSLSLWGFSPQELASIRLADGKEKPYCQAVAAYPPGDAIYDKLRRFLQAVDEYRMLLRIQGIGALIARLMEDLAGPLDRYSLARENQEGLTLLLEYAHTFESSKFGALGEYLSAMGEMMADRHSARDLAHIAAADVDAVQIMTMHAAKGLEFPVVFLPALEAAPHRSRGGEIPIHREMGVGFWEWGEGYRISTPYRERIRAANEKKALEERLRLLYVAMTRAEQRLYLVGSIGETKGETVEERLEKMKDTPPEEARHFLDWLLPAAGAEMPITILRDIPVLSPQVRPGFLSLVEERENYGYLDAELDYQYPYERDTVTPQQATPSQMAKAEGEGMISLPRPMFQGEASGFTGAERGTLVHQAMQLLDWDDVGDRDAIARQLDALVERELYTPQERKAVAEEMLWRFFTGQLFQRIKKAAKVYRELPFNLLAPSRDFYPDGGEGNVMVQGIIDCAFVEDGQLVVVDYKTDYVPKDGAARVAARYRPQLALYAQALERILGMPVKASILYLMRTGEEIAL
ncbi:UvrD-helicase domain-containing protein [Eubacteriales bacterium OttesenSCG-928-M02]|nr:UvrD-helicase domain-containing protein [Eubacteriales bacterium OttesenSCG-928-M02]